VQGAENDLITYYGNARQDVAPYVTANVNLWPRTEVLLANANRFSKLTREQQGWLREAAAVAAAHSTSLFDHDGGITAALCKSGAHFVNASRAQLAALRRALEPVYAGLEQDPQTKTLIAQIEELKHSTSGPALAIPAGCSGPTSTRAASKNEASVLNGVYRVTWSEKELIAGGVFPAAARGDFGYARGSRVVLTMTLRDGRFLLKSHPPGAPWSPCHGAYVVSGNTVSIRMGPPYNCQGDVTARWSLRSGQLRLHINRTDPEDAVVFGRKRWTRIADVPSAFSTRVP
jgi:Bacterial extracellular solute-binding protein, family 7